MSLQSLRHSLLVSERAKLCADARKPVSEYKSVMSKRLVIGLFGASWLSAACGQQTVPSNVVPQYNRDTGRLTSVQVDRDKDGKFEARAFMDGTRIQRIEIDDNADGKPDRWEYYGPAPSGSDSVILRAEEASETTGKICRWEYSRTARSLASMKTSMRMAASTNGRSTAQAGSLQSSWICPAAGNLSDVSTMRKMAA